ncbi:MAG TPA: multicopper oxidase, partial [Candidatus Limnocylindria bacterium]|nr:multicopper oxidase [Candidatus Limnocylindria bacterium]
GGAAEGAPAPRTGDGGLLDPRDIPKFVTPLVLPPVFQGVKDGQFTDYHVAVRQFSQQVLPDGLPPTTVWGYGALGDPRTGEGASAFHSPGFTFDVWRDENVRVTWHNQLVDDPDAPNPRFLTHLTPVDQTLHMANPGAHDAMDPAPYAGPVPIVTHVHGAHVAPESDGLPTAWYLPAAADIPPDYQTRGSGYASQGEAPEGAAIFEYTNDQDAMTLWYHDHTLGMTRNNVYAGMAGFWILHDEAEAAMGLPGPYPKAGDPAGIRYRDIPLAIQDRTFMADGSLFYPGTRAFFDGYEGPYRPDSSVPPIWNPEFFGDAIMVNGRTWPYLEVEPALYRLRVLNGCNSRFLLLRFSEPLPVTQIGTEGGFLPDRPIIQDELLLAPAERADILVDFSALAPGQTVTLLNLGPDDPFKTVDEIEEPADPETTGLVMQFRVVAAGEERPSASVPARLPAIGRLTTDLPERQLALFEMMDERADIPIEAQLGTLRDGPLEFFDPVTEIVRLGDTEIWTLVNLTGDAHPIHPHLVHFQVVSRVPFDAEEFLDDYEDYLEEREGAMPMPEDYALGAAEPPKAWETGWKDTVIAYPGFVTKIIATFDMPGEYVWHCHILEHEDNEMMRPYVIR